MNKTPKWIFTYSNGMVCCVIKIGTRTLKLRKIYLFKFTIPLSHRTIQTCACMSVMNAFTCIQSVVVIMSVEAGIKHCMMRCVVSL